MYIIYIHARRLFSDRRDVHRLDYLIKINIMAEFKSIIGSWLDSRLNLHQFISVGSNFGPISFQLEASSPNILNISFQLIAFLC